MNSLFVCVLVCFLSMSKADKKQTPLLFGLGTDPRSTCGGQSPFQGPRVHVHTAKWTIGRVAGWWVGGNQPPSL